MILRSASSPILKLRIHQSFSPGTRTRAATTRPVSASPTSSPGKVMTRTSTDVNLRKMQGILVPEKKMALYGETASSLTPEGSGYGVSVGGSVSGGGRGGGSFGGGGGGDGSDGSGQGSESIDGYYQEMIKRYPGDALLLANYAQFLKEVRGDEIKAEEYCERAILAKGDDGNLLSMYGDLIWKNHKDSVRAESYFDQAVQSSPDDCYVLASYARFLWDAEDEDEDEDEDEESTWQSNNLSMSIPPVTYAS